MGDASPGPKTPLLRKVIVMRLLVLRFLCLFSLAVWVGGFTFYSAVVIPVLHESLGSLDTGYITQRVTDYLNAAGGVTLALWWLAAWFDRSAKPDLARHLRLWFLVATTIILLALVGLHDLMDQRLGSGSLRGFYPLHRIYVIASTAQWFVNLGLMLLVLVLWRNSSSVGDMGGPGTSH
jgi:Domain of unknown function (DUF4149)